MAYESIHKDCEKEGLPVIVLGRGRGELVKTQR